MPSGGEFVLQVALELADGGDDVDDQGGGGVVGGQVGEVGQWAGQDAQLHAAVLAPVADGVDVDEVAAEPEEFGATVAKRGIAGYSMRRLQGHACVEGESVNREAQQQFTEFVGARQAALLRLAWVLTGDQGAAEDLLQNVLARTASRWHQVRDSPEAYVRKAMYHEQVSRWRSPRWRRESASAELPEVAVADGTDQVDLRLSMERALLALPARSRAVLVLRYYEDLPEAEVARILGCPVGTVRSQTARALARLRTLVPNASPLVEEAR
jgi:RNA polymerase sigma-70 factor (sigma-E family)